MAARRFFLSTTLSLAACATLLSPIVFGQDAATQDEMAKQPFLGQINANAVYIRSAAREDAYPVTKLEKGTQVTVVGIKFKWLKIVPPEGSFAYVPKAWIDRRGNGNVGRASRELIAKVGSDLMDVKTAPMAKIEQGQDVQILGEKDEYYRIKPPEGSYLYIAQQYVDPVKPVAQADVKPQPTPDSARPASPGDKTASQGAAKEIIDALANKNNSHANPPSTQPTTDDNTAVADTAGPATQPADAVATASNTFDQLEGDFKSANEKPITEQPIAQLMSGYEDLLKQDSLPASMRRVAEIRVATLKLRNDAKTEFLVTKASQEKAMERRKALEAERDEIQERIKQNEITVYAAVGTLRTSSIQRGSQTLYRLTDPSTGRTVAYIRTNDSKYATLLGQFIGVKGTINVDAALNMKTIDQPTEAAAVDQSKLNKSVMAQIVPPSMMQGVRSASTGNEN
jgi:SH3-like domain-containing protein